MSIRFAAAALAVLTLAAGAAQAQNLGQDTRQTGHEIANAGRATGHTIADAGRDTGHAVAHTYRKVVHHHRRHHHYVHHTM
jgi:hypothetical protein